MKKQILLLLFGLFYWIAAFPQISVNGTLNNNDLIQSLAGPGVTISNVVITGAAGAFGSFSGGTTGTPNIAINNGVLLTTGAITSAVGPNNLTNAWINNGALGYGPLSALVNGAPTFNATVVDFDITLSGDMLTFRYVFGSEEYHEYVNSQFNDVFAFFISGPGINGIENLAIIPGTTTPVAINTINNGYTTLCTAPGPGVNAFLFRDNCGGTSVQYDGFTRPLVARRQNLTPCATYHITLAIADVSDVRWDSGVFLEAGTFNTSGGTDFTVEINCNDGVFSVTATAEDPTVTNNHWELYQTDIEGATTGGTLVNTIDGGLTATFNWLDLSKFYYIRHYSDICGFETIMVVPTFSGNAVADFHFEDASGVETDVFCAGEDIYLNGTASTNFDRFWLNSRRRPAGDPNAPFEHHADYGWTMGNSIGVFNLSQAFLTQGEHPGEIFEPGFEYEIQLAIANIPECIPWTEVSRTFTVICCDADPAFTLQSECDGGNRKVTAFAIDLTAPNHLWELFETTNPGETNGGTLVATSQEGPTALFSWLDHGKNYYIRHTIWVEGCYFEQYSLAVPDFTDEATLQYLLVNEAGQAQEIFCFGEDVYLRPINITNFDRYFMSVWRRPISGGPFEYYANYGWTSANSIGMLNLSQLFLTSGEDPGEIFEPGFVYELQFAIANPPNCIPWIEVRRQFIVECCDDFFSAFFKYDLLDGEEGMEIEVHDFATYGNVGAAHQWTVLSSPNKTGGPYTFILETTTTGSGPFTLYTQAAPDLYYFVIHRVTTLCGDFCFGAWKSGSYVPGSFADSENCELCGEIDCSILDNLCYAPTLETAKCLPYPSTAVAFTWSPPQGATQFLLEITYNDPACCGSGKKSQAVFQTNVPYISLGGLQNYCFSWRVGTVCVEQVAWTESHCFTGCDAIDSGGGAFPRTQSGVEMTGIADQIAVFPNPADDALTVLIPEGLYVDLVTIISSEGKIVLEQKQPDRQLSIDASRFGNGLYVIRFSHADGTQTTQRIVITH